MRVFDLNGGLGRVAGVVIALFGVLFGVGTARGQGKVQVSAEVAREAYMPGDQGVVAVIFEHAEGWHIHTHDPKPPPSWGLEAKPTLVTPGDVAGFQFGPVQWPVEHTVEADLGATGKSLPYAVYGGTAVAYVPFIVDPKAAAGSRVIEVTVVYQACNDNICEFEKTEKVAVPVRVDAPGAVPAGGSNPGSANFELFKAFDSGIYSKMLSGVVVDAKPLEINFFGRSFRVAADSAWYFAALLLAGAVGGVLLNLTPCVLPVIPIKIMSLSQAAGTPGRCFYLGLFTSLGVVAFWIGIGGMIAFVSAFKAVNQLFQFPWFVIGVGVFVGAMALGMLGLFTFQLPQWIYRFDPKQGSAVGSFFFGVLTAVLSTPCTAPFMAGAMASATKLPAGWVLATFGSIGGGMALPYLLLSAFPKWLEKVPRTGPASELVKQVMGMLMLAVGVYFVGAGLDPLMRAPIDPALRWHWWIAAALACFGMAWLAWRAYQITASPLKRAFWSVVAVGVSGSLITAAAHITDRGPIPWVAYTPERFEKALADQKVVVMDFTAEWCWNCKLLEEGVLHRPQIVKLLAETDVVAMRVDLTGNNEAGQKKLKALDWVGIPLLAVFGPGVNQPLKYDSYTVGTVQEAVAKARGSAKAEGPKVGSR